MKTITIGLILGSFMLSGCSVLGQLGAPKPTFALKDVKFGEVNLNTATLLFDVEVQNPYSAALPLLNIDYDLTTQQDSLFKGQADIATTIPAKATKTVSLPIQLSYSDVIGAMKKLKDVSPGSAIPYNAAIGVSTKAPLLGTIRIPIQRSGQLQVPSVQDVSTWKNIFNAIEKLKTVQ